jgi:hypothetical protein
VVEYKCEWCKRSKKPGQRWMLALAAERVTRSERRRDIHVFHKWHGTWARHPLAVHFCTSGHLERYVSAMFAVTPPRTSKRARGRAVVELETQLTPGSSKLYEAAIDRRHPGAKSPRSSRARTCHFSEVDVIRAHGLGIAITQVCMSPDTSVPSRQR